MSISRLSYQHASAVRSAVVSCIRSSRGDLEDVLGKPQGRRG